MSDEKRVGGAVERDASSGLSRARLVSEALGLIHEEGLEALSMRGLADRLHVKAASLYWHVRDRRELLELLAESVLDGVPASRPSGWRLAVVNTAAAVRAAVASQQDADRILFEVPEALRRSEPYLRMKRELEGAGLQPDEAAEVALMALVHVIGNRSERGAAPILESGATASIAIDSGSRGVVLRSGSAMDKLINVPHDPTAAAPAVMQGETVKVRRLRGVGRGDIELNPRHPWRIQVHGATWNTLLDLGGIDVREIKLDSGATKVECFLPPPRGVVPIDISGGVVGVALHRPPGTAVIADIHSGAVRLKLDDYSNRAVISDVRWESKGASADADRYELRINSGAVQLTLDEKSTSLPAIQVEAAPPPAGEAASALDILLDGVEKRLSSRG